MAAAPDSFKHVLLLAVLAAVALYSFWYTFKAWRENRLVSDMPTSRVRSAAQGYVELVGHGVLPPDVDNPAPLSRFPCTWWRYHIEEHCGSGRSSRWERVNGGVSEVPFLLDDGTGRCLVDPRGAEVFGAEKDVWYGSTPWPEVHLPKGAGVLGRAVDLLFASSGRYRYTEYRMRPNQTVCALGAYHASGGAHIDDAGRELAELLHTWKQDQRALLARFDTNHDGALDAAEWEAARVAARRAVAEKMTAAPPPAAAPAMLTKPTDGRAFLISASDGAALAGRLRRQAGFALAGSLASVAAFVWFAAHL